MEYYEEDIGNGGTIRHEATRWRNASLDVVRFEIHIRGPSYADRTTEEGLVERRGIRPRKTKPVVLKPGEETLLPRAWDRAVQDVRDGHVVGGLAPQLVRVGADDAAPIHPSLVADAARREGADDRLLERARTKGAPR